MKSLGIQTKETRQGSSRLLHSIDRWIADLDRESASESTDSAEASSDDFACLNEHDAAVWLERSGNEWSHRGSLSWPHALDAVDEAENSEITAQDRVVLSFLGRWFGSPADAVFSSGGRLSFGTWRLQGEELAALLDEIKGRAPEQFASIVGRHGIELDGAKAERLVSREPRLMASLVQLGRTPAAAQAQLAHAWKKLQATQAAAAGSARLRAVGGYAALFRPGAAEPWQQAARTDASEPEILRDLAYSLREAGDAGGARDVSLIASTPEL